MRSELPAGHVLPFFVNIFSQQHAARLGDRAVGDHLSIFAVDVSEKVVTVLHVLDQRMTRNLAFAQRDAPRMRLLDAPFAHVATPLLPNRRDEFFRRQD